MKRNNSDAPVLEQIQQLAAEEHHLDGRHALSEEDNNRLHEIQTQLDRCWALLRQRQALRDAGKDPQEAQLRPADIVENYEQ